MSTVDPSSAPQAPPAGDPRTFAVLQAALDCVVTMDASGRILHFNPAAEQTFGYRSAEVVGREMAGVIVPAALRERHRVGLRRYLAGHPPTMLDRRIEIAGLRADGEEFPVELTITRLNGAEPPVFVGYLRDITDRLQAERDLRASRARIVAAADDARRRLERDLHDGAQQRLVALALALRMARDKLPADPEEARELLDVAVDELTSATAELRELARGLHPAVLSEGGLGPAIAGIAARTPIPVQVTGAPAGRLPPAVESTAYFVIAEALTNVARYARALRAEVRLTLSGGRLTVEVRDDGRGGADPHEGSGLRGLADRVSALDGSLVVISPPGGGTTIRAELACAS